MKQFKCSAAMLAVVFSSLFAGVTQAQDSYYSIPIQKLMFTEGTLPVSYEPGAVWKSAEFEQARQPYVVLDGDVAQEGYIWSASERQFDAFSRPLSISNLILRVNGKSSRITGMLVGESGDKAGTMTRLRFSIDPAAYSVDWERFEQVKLTHYRELRDRSIAGAAWFRYQSRMLAKSLNVPLNREDEFERMNARGRRMPLDLSDTFSFFGGGRAVSENLQLDRVLMPSTQPADRLIKLDTLSGITVAEMKWDALIKDLKPSLDPLASIIPGDQHAIFFPTFDAAVKLVDEAQKHGTVLLMAAESRNDDAMTQQRYEKQLCIGLGTFGRLIGPRMVSSVAITGSDAYLRVGSDIAILFETENPDALAQLIGAQLSFQRQINPLAQEATGQVDSVKYAGAVSADRSVCSYVATLGNAVVVTNSLAQLQRLVATHQGKSPALSAAPEYIFFRDRYKREDSSETALLVLTDATIRRWCGPKWRIADSRRTRVGAVLSDLQASQAREVIGGMANATVLKPEYSVTNLGEVRASRDGIVSSTYGSLDFMTPIAEMDFDEVTLNEAESYGRWRNTYQTNWRWAFDPIALRLSLNDNQTIAADLTVMPLIAGTDYRQFIAITSGASLKAGSGDAHEGTIGHLALAINPDSDTLKSYGRMFQNFSGNLRIQPLAWLGSSIAVYADADPFWNELLAAEKAEDFVSKNWRRLPVALYAESRDPLGLAAFLTALHAFADQSAPNMAKWETIQYGDHAYVRITAAEAVGRDIDLPVIYYAATPRAFILTLNENVLKRAIDRQFAPATQPMREWLGGNVGVKVEKRMLDVIQSASRETMRNQMQSQAWANIPILNEWKRMFPDQNPINVHQRLFQVRLIDPAGGTYSWNEQWKTMQSSNYGHPGEPKSGPDMNGILGRIGGNFGLTFENNGLRARAIIEQTVPPQR